MSDLTYAEVGATRHDELPEGYRHIRRRVRLGSGDEVFRQAAEGLLTFAMNRTAGMRPEISAARAADGVRVTSRLGIGPFAIKAPCRVVWTEDEPDRAGFGYGTLAGHPEIGEEAFLVTDEDGVVWFSIVVFSKPAAWYARLGGPLSHLMQDAITDRYIAAMRKIAAP